MTEGVDFNDLLAQMGPEKLGNAMKEHIRPMPVGGKQFKQHRDYGKVLTGMWTGERTAAFAGLSPPAKLVALYLISAPHANMLGLYRLPLAYVAADTGLTSTETQDAMNELSEAELVSYSADRQFIWVRYFIPTQVLGDDGCLNPLDNKSVHAQRVFESLAGAPFRNDLLEAYGQALNLRSLQ